MFAFVKLKSLLIFMISVTQWTTSEHCQT